MGRPAPAASSAMMAETISRPCGGAHARYRVLAWRDVPTQVEAPNETEQGGTADEVADAIVVELAARWGRTPEGRRPMSGSDAGEVDPAWSTSGRTAVPGSGRRSTP